VFSLKSDKLIRHAAVITPNQTEATFLSGIPISTLADGVRACNWLHDERNVPTVIITSMQLSSTHVDVLASTRDGKQLMFSSLSLSLSLSLSVSSIPS
jgi:pyridoxal/pyridoxine/pyridoxamine kinase